MDVSSALRACTFLWSACSFGRARLRCIAMYFHEFTYHPQCQCLWIDQRQKPMQPIQSILISIQWEQRWQSDNRLSSSKACLTEWPFWIVSCVAMRNRRSLTTERLRKAMKDYERCKDEESVDRDKAVEQSRSARSAVSLYQDQSTGTEDYTENTVIHGNEFSCTSSWPCNCHAYSGASAVHGYLSALPLRAHIPKSKRKPFFKSFWNRKANYASADVYESLVFVTNRV